MKPPQQTFDVEMMPALRERLLYQCSLTVHALAASSVVVMLLTLLTWRWTPPAWKWLAAGVMGGVLLALLIARRSARVFWRQLAALLALLSCLLGLALQPWSLGQYVPMMHTSMVTVPLLFNAIIPMGPGWNATLNTLTVAALLLGYTLAFPPYLSALSYVAVTIPPVALMGWVSGVQRRRVWASLHRHQLQLASADRITEIGRRTASIAHELKSPLAASLNTLTEARELQRELSQSIDHPDVTEHDLREIAQELGAAIKSSQDNFERIGGFLQSLQRQSHYQGSQGQITHSFPVLERLEQLLQMYQQQGLTKPGQLRLEGLSPALQLRGDPVAFERIVMNLLENALDASQPGDPVELRFQLYKKKGRLLVIDQGHGVPLSMQTSIFEAMVTTRSDQGQAGLGLSLSRDIARAVFDGELSLLPCDKGATFAFTSPWFAYADQPPSGHGPKITPLAQVR